MPDPRSSSTLELVVNEQQLQNMSQIDLSGATPSQTAANSSQQQSRSDRFSLDQLRRWPTRFRESLSAKLEEAKSKSDTTTEYVFQVVQAFSGIVIWIICFFSTIIIPIFLFFIGLAHLDDCATRPSLPYFIFALGFVMTAANLFNLAMALDLPLLSNHRHLSSDVKNTIASIVNIIFNSVAVFLYILSSYIVFTVGKWRQKDPDSDKNDAGEPVPPECDATLYYFTFWFVTLTLAFIVILSLLAAIFFAYNRYRLALIRGSMPRSQPNATNLPGQVNSTSVSTNRL